MSDTGDHEQELLHQLERDPYFVDWHAADRLLTKSDIDRTIAEVLEIQQGSEDLPANVREHAMRRLALFQVVASHLSDGPRSWIELYSLLRADEVVQVEEILGDLSLGELLE